jgi:transcriptional regulator with XRE-family HTH domain
LDRALKRRGAKLALTRELGVSTSSIYEWLAGTRSPNAEMTLHLLQWVEQVEAKQKTSGSAENTTRGERTQQRKTRNANPKSGPPKS